MPTISFSYEDLCKLIGRKLDDKKFQELLEKAKGELESKLTTETTVQFNDTNQPYLWSVEGLARLFRGLLGKDKGLQEIKIEKPKDKVIYDKRLTKIRPYIACFKATGKKIDEQLLKQIIQLQEKLTDNFGKKREKISIGVYPLKKILFPVQCKAAKPTEKFTPLGMHESISLRQALEKHPKGQEYGHLIKKENYYPIFVDAKGEILSLIPIINSEATGKLSPGDDSLFFDTTGTDEEAVNLAANIFAYALADRGFKIEALTIQYPTKKVSTPTLKTIKVRFNENEIEKVLGVKLKETEIKMYLEKMGYDYKKGSVTIPSYRNDIMHNVDIVEDIAIAIGYDNLEPLPLESYTQGGTTESKEKSKIQRELWVGLGYQEIISQILSNKELMYAKMNTKDKGTVEITNPASQTYSCVRSWILPILLDVLSKNKHVDYPQKIFEQGIITKYKNDAIDENHLAAVSAHTNSGYTEIRQAVEATLRNSGIEYSIDEFEHDAFIPGRAAKVIVNKQEIGILGEIHPAVLKNFGIHVPVSGCEINLSSLF